MYKCNKTNSSVAWTSTWPRAAHSFFVVESVNENRACNECIKLVKKKHFVGVAILRWAPCSNFSVGPGRQKTTLRCCLIRASEVLSPEVISTTTTDVLYLRRQESSITLVVDLRCVSDHVLLMSGSYHFNEKYTWNVRLC